MAKQRVRAAPMSPVDRRAAIIEATIPLLQTRGFLVTTKEIARAAQVAEGTIFAVFTDKEELLVAALAAAIDPSPTAEALAGIDHGLPLKEQLLAAIDILQERMRRTWELSGLFTLVEVRKNLKQDLTADFLVTATLPLFQRSRAELGVSPTVAAKTFVALAMGGLNPFFFAKPLTRAELVTALLDGIRPVRAAAGSQAGGRKRAS